MVSRVFVAFSISVLLLACGGGDYQIALPDGYFIARVRPGDFALIAPDKRTVVIRTVKAYTVHGPIVAGQTSSSAEGQPLYFIVNTRTRSAPIHLPRPQWKNELARLGIQSVALKEPQPYQALSRWFSN